MREHNHPIACEACEELVARERAAHASAEAAIRSTYEFLLAFSHELRGRLNAITGWAGVLRAQMAADDEVCGQALETIERNAWAQASLVEQMLSEIRGRAERTVLIDRREPESATRKRS